MTRVTKPKFLVALYCDCISCNFAPGMAIKILCLCYACSLARVKGQIFFVFLEPSVIEMWDSPNGVVWRKHCKHSLNQNYVLVCFTGNSED